MMQKYMITYFGGTYPKDEEVSRQNQQKYMQWIQDLGDKAVSAMNPLKNTHTLTKGHEPAKDSAHNMSGFTVIKAESIEDAITIASACPFLDIDGTLEVAEMIELGG